MKTEKSGSYDYIIFAFLSFSAALWFGLFSSIPARFDSIPTFDAVFFIKLADNIFNFKELGWISFHEPLFYSFVTALLNFITDDSYVSAILISKISAVFLPGLVYIFAKDVFSRQIAIIAAILILFFPHIRAVSSSPQSESFYLLLITISSTLLWHAWQNKSFILAISSAIFFSLAYLTRSEAVFTMFFLLVSLNIFNNLKENYLFYAKISATVLIAFTIIASPYIFYLSQHYGAFTLGTKTSSIYFWVRDKCFHDPDPHRAEWGLSPNGELNLISMKSEELIKYWGKDLKRSASVYFNNLVSEIPGRIPNDGAIKQYPQIYPLYLAIPVLFAIVLIIRKKKFSLEIGYLLAPFLMLFIYPLLTEGWWRYLLNLLPYFLILSAKSIHEIATSVVNSEKPHIAVAFILLIVSTYHIFLVTWQPKEENVKKYMQSKSTVAQEVKKAGKWVRSVIPQDATYMAQWTRLPFYLVGRWVGLPETDFNNLLKYAKRNKVSYLLVESGSMGDVVQLASQNLPGTKYLGSYSATNGGYFCSILKLDF